MGASGGDDLCSVFRVLYCVFCQELEYALDAMQLLLV